MDQWLEPSIQIRSLTQHAGGEFVCQATIGILQIPHRLPERLVEGLPFLYRPEHPIGGSPGGEPGLGHPAIPVVGLEGTATSRFGMRPARYASRPASTA